MQKFISETSEVYGQCICKACVVSARRNMKKRNSGENFTPRWKIQTNTSCSVPFCSHVSAINNHPFCWNEICSTVGIASVEFDESDLKPLCIKHYGLVYRFVNAIQIHEELCQVCGVRRKHDKLSIKEKFVSCTNPNFVESFLRENLEIEVDISYNDLLCFSCYKYFNRLLKSWICTLSSEEVIIQLKELEMRLVQAVEKQLPEESDSDFQLALLKTAIHVCSIMLLDRAILFSDIHEVFLQCYLLKWIFQFGLPRVG